LYREKLKAGRYWQEQCDERARNEDELETKDIEISLLKAKLLVSPKVMLIIDLRRLELQMNCSSGPHTHLQPVHFTK